MEYWTDHTWFVVVVYIVVGAALLVGPKMYARRIKMWWLPGTLCLGLGIVMYMVITGRSDMGASSNAAASLAGLGDLLAIVALVGAGAGPLGICGLLLLWRKLAVPEPATGLPPAIVHSDRSGD